MDHYLDECKARVKMTVQKVASQSQTILGEPFQLKSLLEIRVQEDISSKYIVKVVINNGHIFYQMSDSYNILKVNDCVQSITTGEFYDNFFETVTKSYPKPQLLTLGATVIKTEKTYTDFVVAEHFTKKIYFIAHDTTTPTEGFLYAADIGKGAQEVVAEKVELSLPGKLEALTVDQLTGDIILTTHSLRSNNYNKITLQILFLRKLPYLSEMLTFAGISSSKENVKQED